MRAGLVLVAITACGGATPAAQPPAPRDLDLAPGVRSASVRAARPPRAPLDPMLGLGDPSDETISWVTPAQAWLEIAATPIEVPQPLDAIALPTTILDEQGSLVRVAVRLPHARFSLWTERQWLFSVVQSDTRVRSDGVVGVDTNVEVRLRTGARVRVIKHGEGVAQVRYVGEVELVGWIPDELVGDEGRRNSRMRTPGRRKPLHVARGAVIRSEPKWASAQLAVTNRAYVLDAEALAGNWYAVTYADEDVTVRGYYQHPSPPGRTSPLAPDVSPSPITPNTTVRGATCLYARPRGEPVGYIAADTDAYLEPARESRWWTIGIDTPWGPILFAAHGHEPGNLVPCMPTAAVPAATSP